MTWVDPIVQEVREAREELARQANYDLHTLFQNLRKNEKKVKKKQEEVMVKVDRGGSKKEHCK